MKYLVLILIMLTSCAYLQGYKTKEFLFREDQKIKKLVLHVPGGFADEKMVLDTVGGKEQYYYYDNGALLYFAKQVNWQTENEPLIHTGKIRGKSYDPFSFNGVDRNGLHWKEIRIEDFRFGYSYVPPSDLDKFEQAINNIRIKKSNDK